LVSQAFRHKRKTLRNNLAQALGKSVNAWPEAGMRAEQLSLEQFAAIYQRIVGQVPDLPIPKMAGRGPAPLQ
jgi:16S rRNA A1518/A1519 N6-dimethyltransferase RsmA/KsgA/DIM1 with predicted DNA glycosylase/AP lyase activity